MKIDFKNEFTFCWGHYSEKQKVVRDVKRDIVRISGFISEFSGGGRKKTSNYTKIW